jgi:hypothetical protein
MSYDECIAVFRDECREHLPWEEAQTYLGLLESHRNWEICQQMSLLKKGGRVPSPRFEKALETFYWSFVQ